MKISWNEMTDSIKRYIQKRGPDMLIGFGITSMLAGTVWAARNTPEAQRRMAEEKRRLKVKKLTCSQIIRTAGPCYIPAFVCEVTGAFEIMTGSRIKTKRTAAIATACSLAQSSLREYQSQVIESIGERKEGAIRDAIDQRRIDRNPPDPQMETAEVADGDDRRLLCYDAMFGRYFYSNKERLQRALNKLNWQMNNGSENYISLNEWYAEIDMPSVEAGDLLGWNRERGLIDLRFSSQLANGRTPCLVISYVVPPDYDYTRA